MAPWREEIWSELARNHVVCICTPVQVQPGIPDGLSALERQRAERFHREADRAAFCTGRTLMRQLLIPGEEPGAVEIRIGEKGKPECPDPRAFGFNLTHAAGWVALVLSGRGAVGVDLESPLRRVHIPKLSERFFSEHEQAWVREEGPEAFFRIWTRKEARLKAEGTGISTRLADVDTLLEGPEPWSYHEFRLPDGPLGCVSVPWKPAEIRVWCWFPADQRLQSL